MSDIGSEESKPKNIREYLKQHLPPRSKLSPAEQEAFDREFFTPLGSIKYGPEGIFNGNREGLSLSFGFRKLNSVEASQVDNTFTDTSEPIIVDSSDLFKIENIILQNQSDTLDISGLLPPNVSIYGNPFILEHPMMFGGKVNEQFDSILLESNPSMIGNVLILLHEIGHIKATEASSNPNSAERVFEAQFEIDSNYLYVSDEAAEIVLRSERNAWAFALKVIKPFIKDGQLNRQTLSYFIYNRYLNTYEQNIQGKLRPKGTGNI